MTDSKTGHILVRETPPSYIWIARIVKASAVGYLAVLVLMIALETRLVFPGAGPERGDWTHRGLSLEEVEFPSEDGTKVFGFYFPQANSERYVLFCHGNGENIAMIASEMDQLRAGLNASVFAFDYRGYGKTKGSPSESTIVADAQAASKWLEERSGKPASEHIFFGRSLGGGVAVQLAAKFNPQALILDRTFSSTVDVAADRYWFLPVRIVMRNQFWSSVRIKEYDGPLFQMHGDVDEVIPYWSGVRLFQRSPSEDKEFMEVPTLTHMEPWPNDFISRVNTFLDESIVTTNSDEETKMPDDADKSKLQSNQTLSEVP